MVNVRKVMLSDSNPSARTIIATCRECLWGLVERVKRDHEQEEVSGSALLEKSESNDNDVATPGAMEGECLPMDFATSSGNNFHGKKRKIAQVSKQRMKTKFGQGGLAIPVLPQSKGDKFVIEENLMMCTYPGDGLMYPSRVLGNGPTRVPYLASTSGESYWSVMVSFLPLEYAAPNECTTCFETTRSPQTMASIPDSYRHQIRGMLETERFNTSGQVFEELARSKEKAKQKENSESGLNLTPKIADSIDLSSLHEKYWDQRYRLFSKYDRGILLDAESWFSVTPEVISKHIATRCVWGMRRLRQETLGSEPGSIDTVSSVGVEGAVAVDIFSGCGGNAIALAEVFPLVIANDIDPLKVRLLCHNASLYGVGSRVNALIGDAYDLLGSVTTGISADPPVHMHMHPPGNGVPPSPLTGPADLLVLAPPWGGSDYSAHAEFDLHTMIPSGDFFDLIRLARHYASNMVCILPKNTPKRQIEEISTSILNNKLHPCTVEDIFINGKCKMTVVYFGLLFANKVRRSRVTNGESTSSSSVPPIADNKVASNSVNCVSEIPLKTQIHIRFDDPENTDEA